MNYIDAHSHVWTPDTEHYPLAAGFFRANMQPPSFTAEELKNVPLRYPSQLLEIALGVSVFIGLLVADRLMGKEKRPRRDPADVRHGGYRPPIMTKNIA